MKIIKKDPIIGKYPPTNFSPSRLIRKLANNLAIISPELKKTITRPPRKSGAVKSFVNHKEDQSTIIPTVAKFIISNMPNINIFFSGI